MFLPLEVEITSFFPNQEDHIIRNLLITAEGIFAAKSTNLNLVKDEIGNILENQERTKPESNYKRLIRFEIELTNLNLIPYVRATNVIPESNVFRQ